MAKKPTPPRTGNGAGETPADATGKTPDQAAGGPAATPPSPGDVPHGIQPPDASGITPPQQLTVAGAFGEIVWLLTQTPKYKNFFVSDLEWLVMTPLLLQQYRIFHNDKQPVGVAFWAFLSEEAEARLKSGAGRIAPQDWKSGDRCWVVEIVAPYGRPEVMLEDLRKTVLADQTFHFHYTSPEGKQEVKTVTGVKV